MTPTATQQLAFIEEALAMAASAVDGSRRALDALKGELRLPVLTARAEQAEVEEDPSGKTELRFTVERTGDPAVLCRCVYNVLVDGAESGGGLIEFMPGVPTRPAPVFLLAEHLVSDVTTVTATLTDPLGCTIGDPASAATTIRRRPRHASGLPWRSGFRLPRNDYAKILAEYPQLETWRGRKLDVIGQFITLQDARSWPKLVKNAALGGTKDQPKGCVQAIFDGGWTPVLGVPLLIQGEARRFDRLAAGEFDEQHRAVARRVAEISQGRLIYVRLGWEYPQGYPWSWIGDAAGDMIPDTTEWQDHYRLGWARIAAIWHQECPGAKTVWCSLKNTRRATDAYYPGDEACDVLGMDLYNQLDGVWVNDEASWRKFGGSYREGYGFNGPLGLAEFARRRGKTISICEWGPYNRSRTAGDEANHPFFVSRMFDWFQELGELLEYEVYFQAGSDAQGRLGQQVIFPDTAEFNPLPRQSYLARWRPAS